MIHDLRRRARRTACIPIALAAAIGCSDASTPEPSELSSGHASYEQALALTTRMLDRYRQADSYTDHAVYVEESVLRGEGIPRELPYFEMSLAFVRPNRLRLAFSESVADAAGHRSGFDIASDGEFLRITSTDLEGQMVERPAPSELDSNNVLADPLMRQYLLGRSLGDVFPQLAMLLDKSDDDDAAIFPHDSKPRLLADEEIGSRICRRVATSHPGGTRVLWIDRDTYALRRMELPIDAHRQEVDPDGRYLRLAVRIDFLDVELGPQIDPRTFQLNSRRGYRRVRRFVLPTDKLEAAGAADVAD